MYGKMCKYLYVSTSVDSTTDSSSKRETVVNLYSILLSVLRICGQKKITKQNLNKMAKTFAAYVNAL